MVHIIPVLISSINMVCGVYECVVCVCVCVHGMWGGGSVLGEGELM